MHKKRAQKTVKEPSIFVSFCSLLHAALLRAAERSNGEVERERERWERRGEINIKEESGESSER